MFAPGSLNMTRLEAFSQCYVDPVKYANYIDVPVTCSISDAYKLVFHTIPKSASSTGRIVMETYFNATEERCHDILKEEAVRDSYFHFTMTRDPLSRFFSSFDEMLFRYVNRRSNRRRVYRLPEAYQEPFKPFQHMTNKRYMRVPAETILQTFEHFTNVYDGADPFDVHLRLQVPTFLLKWAKGVKLYQIQTFTH